MSAATGIHHELVLNGQALTIDDVVSVARQDRRVMLGDAGRRRITAARHVVEAALESGEVIYGVNTGFGGLSRTRIEPGQVEQIQTNLVRSHSAGVGEPLPGPTVRAMMVILAASLCRGCSGVRPIVVQTILDLLNHKITPVVPSIGSVGASGDLAPLAHMALTLTGQGHAMSNGAYAPAIKALADASITPLVLQAKEGLALINGTHLMTAVGTLALHDLENLIEASIAATALSIDACRATDAFLDDAIHVARNQAGQREAAGRIAAYLEGSQIVKSHEVDDPRVQDPYSLRCAPVILGAMLDTRDHVLSIFERELGSVTDNPVIVVEDESTGAGRIISGGNFHGIGLATAMDALVIAVAHLAGVSERRVYYLLAATDSENPVNIYLSPQPGLHSGLMIAQYTAAACCNEIQTLCVPASVANIPTSAGMEDYNSFGPRSGAQLARAIQLATTVTAIEMLCCAEALEYHRPLTSGHGVEALHAAIRKVVPRLTADRPLTNDVAALERLIGKGWPADATGRESST